MKVTGKREALKSIRLENERTVITQSLCFGPSGHMFGLKDHLL